MHESNTVPTTTSRLALLGLTLACIALGAAIGVMMASLLSTQPEETAASLSGALGEIIGGAVIGLIAGLYLARDLSNRARWWSAAFATLLAAGTLWSLTLAGN